MAAAESTYIEPSALARLFLNQHGSRELSLWCARTHTPIDVTLHGKAEIVNAICRSCFTKEIDDGEMEEALADLEQDFITGRFKLADVLWRSALHRSAELSKEFTPLLGVRSLDVLHVACALELGKHHFLTFDVKQQALATKAGLKIVRIL
ncbi:MAG TPA: type II toxin-antitoxin system VapC family toxin [Verrucomicrobiae bacterium]